MNKNSQQEQDRKQSGETALAWIVGDDTGISSEVIWAVMMGVDPKNILDKSTPSDPSDFGRCYRLLKLIPEWEKRLEELRKVDYHYHLMNDNSEHTDLWGVFVDNYSQMCGLYEEEKDTGKCEKLYNFMKEKF